MSDIYYSRSMYEAIALSGGGYKALCHLGALAYLEDAGIAAQLSTFSGSSAGSIVAAMAALNSGNDCARELFRRYASRDMIRPIRYNNFLSKYGIVTPMFEDLEVEIASKLGSKNATLRDLYRKTGKRVIVSAFGVSDGKTRFFGEDDSTMDTSLLSVLRASSAIPVLMSPVSISNRLYVDGAIRAYVPMQPLKDVPSSRVVGMSLSPRVPREIEIRNAFEFIEALVTSVLRSLNPRDSPHASRVCYLDDDDRNLGFGLQRPDLEQAQKLFTLGYAAMRERHRADSDAFDSRAL